ncbi:hypothetical protein DFR58_103128 [Anaerobacterium chartisolvens]|uniref:Uncharacterized protein n=1 Tax=Anaerobacterium chartisolvens TaxID=1297424 RepID=A0A369BCX2_9FIRM|nr:DUF6179 domain-containing protein [Anaerobacterium chartisolvens]RCX19383.1 hypothetical protein DFR58_103128 [Anaerobacterium chartisolvens]
MSNIERSRLINEELLSGEFYFQSLVEQAFRQGLIDDRAMEGIQMQSIRLLAERTERFNQGDSSSVKIEKAQSIMISNFYTMSVYLKSLPDADAAVAEVTSTPISEIYKKGRRMLDIKLHSAKHFYSIVCRNKIQTPNHDYNATIDEGIKSFFYTYDTDFAAHEIIPVIDYPLSTAVTDLAGLEYIQRYLGNLQLENLFCSRFDAAAIHRVMLGYDTGYGELLINIYQQVLSEALGCALLCKNIQELYISHCDTQKLEHLFAGKSKEEIHCLVSDAAFALCRTLGITNDGLQKYILATLHEISSRVYNAAGSGALSRVIVIPQQPDCSEPLRYSAGEKMDDEKYRGLIDEILQCRYAQDKLEIIKNNISSLEDIEDVLVDAELDETEAFEVLKLLGEAELSVLAGRHLYGMEVGAADCSDREKRLQQYLSGYLSGLPCEIQKEIKRLAGRIKEV